MDIIISQADLCAIIIREFKLAEDSTASIEELGKQLPLRAHPGVAFAVTPPYWARLKDEFRLFLCTNNKPYADLRKQFAKNAQRSQTIVVSTIAAAMAPTLGVAAGVLVPFCALCLLALARMGTEAFCKGAALDDKIYR